MLNPPVNGVFCKFVGTWKLIDCIETDSNGAIFYPWGQDALGYLVYTLESIMAVQIMRKTRKLNGDLLQDYNAYFGRFEIDETNKTVIHSLEGNLNPAMVGKKKIRCYRLYDDRLSLVTQKEVVSRELIWQKVVA